MRSKPFLAFGPILFGFVFATPSFASLSYGLADWCVNLNGDINTACNGAGGGGSSPLGGSISLASFDTTLEPGSNNLGSITVNLVAGENGQFAAFYADYDVSFSTEGSFQDSASTHNGLPAGYSYELADPNISNIFSDFASGPPLPDTNGVGTYSAPPSPCCDAAFALSISGLNVPVGGSGTVIFTVSSTAPAGGFYIQQTNGATGVNLYLSATENITGAVPEPSSLVLSSLGVLGIGLALWRRSRDSKYASVV